MVARSAEGLAAAVEQLDTPVASGPGRRTRLRKVELRLRATVRGTRLVAMGTNLFAGGRRDAVGAGSRTGHAEN
jgi:hypothetical protein